MWSNINWFTISVRDLSHYKHRQCIKHEWQVENNLPPPMLPDRELKRFFPFLEYFLKKCVGNKFAFVDNEY